MELLIPLLVLGGLVVFLYYLSYKLIYEPNVVVKRGAFVRAATLRGRTIVFDKNDFGKAEVIEGRQLNDGSAEFRLRTDNNTVILRRYMLVNLVPYNMFSLMCGQGPIEVMHIGTKLEMDGKSSRHVKELEERERQRREERSKRIEAVESLEEEKTRLVDAIIKLEQAKSGGGFKGG